MDLIKKPLKLLIYVNTRGFRIGFVAGLLYFSYIFWWLWSLYPLDAFGVESRTISILLILVVFLLSMLAMAVPWAIFGFFAEKFYKKTGAGLLPLVLASAFTLTEYSRSIFFSIFWYGNGGTIGPHWPFGNIAYLFAGFDPIALTASWWGIYGIEFWVILIASATALFFLKKQGNKIYTLQIFLAVLAVFTFNFLGKNILENGNGQTSLPISIVQTNKPLQKPEVQQEADIEDFKIKLELLEKASRETRSEVIVFPETTNFIKSLGHFLNAGDIENYFKKISSRELLIVDSVRLFENNRFKSRAVFISSKDGVIDSYDKRMLSIGGEYLPYVLKAPLKLFGSGLVSGFESYLEYSPGYKSGLVRHQNLSMAILICSDVVSPSLARENNPEFIIVTGSYPVWRGSRVARSQILSAARFRAIENGKYLVLATNSDQSYIINPSGKVEKSGRPNSYELLTGEIIPNKNRTWYNYLGDWPILSLSSAFFAIGLKKILDAGKS